MRTKRHHVASIFLAVLFCAGLGMTLYPLISNFLFETDNADAVVRYENLRENDQEAQRLEGMGVAARAYNKALSGDERENTSLIDGLSALSEQDSEVTQGVSGDNRYDVRGSEPLQEYLSLLWQDPGGVMATLAIPAIDVDLPVYWGTSIDVLSRGVGYLEGTSLPVGGPGSHCALTAHAGMASKKLFTDIDTLELGDTFIVRTAGETATYEIDQILTVEPHDVSALAIEDDKDYVTLVTCTPYGLNSHRLLVRGERVGEDARAELKSDQATLSLETVVPDEQWVREYLVAFVVGAMALVLVIITVVIARQVRAKKKSD